MVSAMAVFVHILAFASLTVLANGVKGKYDSFQATTSHNLGYVFQNETR